MGDVDQPIQERQHQRTALLLAISIAVLIIAVALLVAYVVIKPMVASSQSASTATVPHLPTSDSFGETQSAESTQRTLSLRTTAAAYVGDMNRAHTTSSLTAAVKKYAVARCAQLISDFFEAFGGGDMNGRMSLVSVRENGNDGVVVTRDSNDGATETHYWLRKDGHWKLTCRGVFGQEATDTTTEASPPTALPTSTAVEAGSACTQAQARSFARTPAGQSVVCLYMGNQEFAWVSHGDIDGQTHDVGDLCDDSGPTVSQDRDGKAIMCAMGTWTIGP